VIAMLARVRQYLARLRTRLGAARLTITPETVAYRWPLRPRWTVSFRDLVQVRLKTTDHGPMFEDVFWVLVAMQPDGRSVSAVIPAEFDVTNELRDRLMDLPGFNHEAMLDAFVCVENREIVCWVRGVGAGGQGA
jgi:hypothetical protein